MEAISALQPNTKRLADDPEYFGTYLMMARHNVFLIANHIAEKFPQLQLTKLDDDAKIAKAQENPILLALDPRNRSFEEQREGIFHYLKRLLPLVKVFNPEDLPKQKLSASNATKDVAGIDFESLHHFLSVAFQNLSAFRDSYAHFLAFREDDPREMIPRHTHLHNSITEDLSVLFRQAPLYSYFNFTSTQEGVADTHEPEDFFHLNRIQIFEHSSPALTLQGFCFFISLFLEKHYIIRFLKRISGFKRSDAPKYRATLDAYMAYGVRLPHEKLISDNPQQALLLDMLNELNRCPAKLFYHLTPEGKKSFEVEIDDEAVNNIIDNLETENFVDDDALERHLLGMRTLRRHEDRFPYFALRFLEQSPDLGSKLKFQIRLGKVFLRSYPKQMLGTTIDRSITKNLNAYGMLSDFYDEANTLANITGLPEAANVFFEQYSPHYHLSLNKIGFIFSDECSLPKYDPETGKLTQRQPDAFLSIHDLPKLALLELLQPSKAFSLIRKHCEIMRGRIYDTGKLQSIRDRITYEPPTFSRRNENQFKFKITALERSKRKEYQSLLAQRRAALAPLLGVNPSQLPTRIADYLMKIEPVATGKSDHLTITRLKNEVKQRIKAAKAGRYPKIGEMATYLAKDIVAMLTDKDVKARFTTPYYRKLQNKIAYLSMERENVVTLLDELAVFKQDVHPFLQREHIQTSASVRGFYESYLDAKHDWIVKTFVSEKGRKTIQAFPANKPVPYALAPREAPSLAAFLQSKKMLPIELPSTLFDAAVTKALCEKLRERGVADINPKARFALLLEQYLEGDSQPCYGMERAYKLKRLVKQGNPRKNIPATYEFVDVHFRPEGKDSKTLKHDYDANVEANEKLIRFHRTKDRILRLICEHSLQQSGLSINGLKLANIYPASPNTPLGAPAHFRQGFPVPSKNNGQAPAYTHFIVARDVAPQQAGGYTWTLRDYGAFRRVLHDRRLPALFSYFAPGSDVPFGLVMHELEHYDRNREQVLELIFRLEQRIALADPSGIRELARGKTYDQVEFKYYLTWLDQHAIEYNKQLLQHVRNAFSHTQFPAQDATGIETMQQAKMDDFDKRQGEAGFLQAFGSVAGKTLALYQAEVDAIMGKISGNYAQ